MNKRKIITISITNAHRFLSERGIEVSFRPYMEEPDLTQDLGTFYKNYYCHNGPLKFLPLRERASTLSVRSRLMGFGFDDDESIKYSKRSPFFQERVRPLSRDWRYKIALRRKTQVLLSVFRTFELDPVKQAAWIAFFVAITQGVLHYVTG